jgi:nucleoside recognition membrane protein YjiH
MKRKSVVVVTTVGIGVCATLGVVVSSQVFLDQSLEHGLESGVQAGLIAALVALGTHYTRRYVR